MRVPPPPPPIEVPKGIDHYDFFATLVGDGAGPLSTGKRHLVPPPREGDIPRDLPEWMWRADPGLPGARLGRGAGARAEPPPSSLSRRASGLPGIPGCAVSPEGVYSPQAKGDLRGDQRTDPDVDGEPVRSDSTASRNRPASGGGNLVTKQRRDHHHAEQASVTRFP